MKIKNIITGTALAATFGGMVLSGCTESELYSAGAPDWIADSVSAVAARNAANAGEGIDKNTYGTLHETFTSKGWEFPKLHVEAQVGTWTFTSSDGKYTDETIIGTKWWNPQSIDANADDKNWTSSDFELTDGDPLILTFVPQTENAVVMWEYYGNGYWTTMSEGNWWYAEDALPDKGGTGTGATSGYSYEDNGGYHFEVGSTVTLVITKSGSNYTAEVYYKLGEDAEPISMELTNVPKNVPIADDMNLDTIMKAVTATVTYEGDLTADVTAQDLILQTIPNFGEPGKYTLVALYSSTLKGNGSTNPVMATKEFEVVAFKSIEIDDITLYISSNIATDSISVRKDIIVAKGVNSTGDKTTLTSELIQQLTFEKAPAKVGEYTVKGNWNGIETSVKVKVVAATENTIEFTTDMLVGNGQILNDETYGTVLENDNAAQRTSYLLLPENTIPDCSTSKEMTISFYVNGNSKAAMYAPIFSAYAAAPVDNANTTPMFIIQGRCLLQTNIEGGWIDFTETQNVTGSNVESIEYLEDNKWHLVTVTITESHAEFVVDNKVINAWDYNGDVNGGSTTGLLTNGNSMLKYICLGGNQAWNWGDNDSGYKYAKLMIFDKVISVH